MDKLEEGHVSFLHVFIQIADGGSDTPPLEESSPVPFKIFHCSNFPKNV